MQATIGALHRLGHRKIAIGEERERNFIRHFLDRFGAAAREVLECTRAPHPPFLGDRRLEELAVSEPLHAALEGIAARQAEREAVTLAALLRRFGDDAEVEIRLSAYDHGWQTGDRIARVRPGGPIGPAEAYDLLAENYPDGIACCPSMRLLAEEESCTSWAQFGSEVLEGWARAGVPAEVMCSMVAFWCKGFGEGLNPEIVYRKGKSLAAGEPYLEGSYRLPGPGGEVPGEKVQ